MGWIGNWKPYMYVLYFKHLSLSLSLSLYKEKAQEKVNCCFQPLFSSFLPVFKKNSCYVPVLSSLPDSSWEQYFKYILAVLSSHVLNF